MVATLFFSQIAAPTPSETLNNPQNFYPSSSIPVDQLNRMPIWMSFLMLLLGTGVFTQLSSLLIQWKKLDNELIGQRSQAGVGFEEKLRITQQEKEELRAVLRDIKTIANVHLNFLKKSTSLDAQEIDVLIRGYESIILLYQDLPGSTGITRTGETNNGTSGINSNTGQGQNTRF